MNPPLAWLADEGFLRPGSAWGLALVPAVVLGIHWMRSPKSAVRGNRLSMAAMAGFVLLPVLQMGLWRMPLVWFGLLAGTAAGVLMAGRVRMIRMPELIALFNGIGGGASALVAMATLLPPEPHPGLWVRAAAMLALGIGGATCSGSAVAFLKLARWLAPAPVSFRGHAAARMALGFLLLAAMGTGMFAFGFALHVVVWSALVLTAGLGLLVMMRVGGADMPVSISLLNALSGVAAAVAGFAVGHPVPVAVGAVVGAGGLMLTRLMCRAMNRRLSDVLGGHASPGMPVEMPPEAEPNAADSGVGDPLELLRSAKRVAIVPGYGMALGQAQRAVRRLFDVLSRRGTEVCFAIHPVAGRMPGHMHVLLAEVDIPYDRFLEIDEVNPMFPGIDVALVVGANDVVNPAAAGAVGTPIHGMPILRADRARAVVVCNLDDRPGYAGVANPLFRMPNTRTCFGDAAETVTRLAEALEREGQSPGTSA